MYVSSVLVVHYSANCWRTALCWGGDLFGEPPSHQHHLADWIQMSLSQSLPVECLPVYVDCLFAYIPCSLLVFFGRFEKQLL